MRTILGRIIQANKVFNLIENNDRICVGVSGGKDSMSLLFALSLLKTKLKKELNWNIEIYGIHLKMNLCAIEYEKIIEYWNKKGINFVVVPTKMGEILKQNMKNGKLQCSLCSKMKKAIIIDKAKELNCNKVAMGHHSDDAIETLFMNMINEGRISTFKPKMFLDRTNITFIRPLILVREKEIKSATKKIYMPIIPCGCPMEGFTQRDRIKSLLDNVFYKDPKFKQAYKNFYISLINNDQFDLWFKDDDNQIFDLKNKLNNNN